MYLVHCSCHAIFHLSFSRLNSGPKTRAAVPVSQSRRNFITVSCSSERLFWPIFRQRSIHSLFSVSKKVLHSHSPVCAVTNSQANTGAVSLDSRWVANQTWIIRNSSAATPPSAWLCLPTCTHCYTHTVSPLVCLLSFSPSPSNQHKTLYVSSHGNRTSISKTVGLPMQLKLIRATFKCYSYQTQIRNAGQSSCKAPSLPSCLDILIFDQMSPLDYCNKLWCIEPRLLPWRRSPLLLVIRAQTSAGI